MSGTGFSMDKTLIKGLQVLEQVVRSEERVRITDVAAVLNLTKSNAHRLLKTLESVGYVHQDPRTKDFGPSLKLWELGSEVVGRLDLRLHAAGVLRRLAQASREAVHLSILDGKEVIYIDKLDSAQPIGSYTWTGGRAPAYCVATGKALLSHLPPADLKALLVDLKPHSPHTITDPELLLEELAIAKQQEVAFNRGEWRESFWGIASVIRDASRNIVAAIGVSGSAFRFNRGNRCEVLADMVREAAHEISINLGYRLPND
jgi:IclR family KDG regulon transcriptional repressor